MRWALLVFLILGLALYALSSLGSHDESLAKIQDSGIIRIGYAVEAPYAFNKPDGSVTGEASVMVREVCSMLGIEKIEWVQTSFDRLIPGLEEGRFDVVASGLFITPERSERVLFSRPKFIAQTGLLVYQGNPLGIESVDDVIEDAELVIAVLDGGVEATQLERAGVQRSQLMIVPDAATGRAAVQSQAASGLALSAATIRWMARDNQESLEAVVPFDTQSSSNSVQYGALAFGPRANRLRAAFDDCLKQLVGTQRHLELIQPFGFTAADCPANQCVQQVQH